MVTRDGFIVTSLLSLTLALAGCGVGDTGGGGDIGDDQVGLQCEAELTLSGTFAPKDNGPGGGIDPLDPDASWECDPVGTWTLNVTVSSQGDCAEVAVASQYVYNVVADESEGWIAEFPADSTGELSVLKIQTEGPCLGNFEHYSPDGKQLTRLKPAVDTEQTKQFSGSGVYELYNKSQLD